MSATAALRRLVGGTLLLGLLGSATLGATLLVSTHLRAGAPSAASPDAVVTAASALLLLGALVWLDAAVAAELAGRLRGDARVGMRGGGRLARWLVSAALGSSLVAAPALAAPAPETVPGLRAGLAALTGLPLPDRVVTPADRPTPDRATPVVHTVSPGETLWSIARDRLGDSRGWPALYRSNARLIGPDPDVVRVGQRLRLPADALTPVGLVDGAVDGAVDHAPLARKVS